MLVKIIVVPPVMYMGLDRGGAGKSIHKCFPQFKPDTQTHINIFLPSSFYAAGYFFLHILLIFFQHYKLCKHYFLENKLL